MAGIVLGAMLGFAAASPASAVAAQPTPYVDCADAMTQADMTRCAGADFAAADAQLNRQWTITSDVMKQRDSADPDAPAPGYHGVLLDAQRKWIAFRDAHCRAAGYQERGGSLQSTLIAACLTSLTQDRVQWLKDLAGTTD